MNYPLVDKLTRVRINPNRDWCGHEHTPSKIPPNKSLPKRKHAEAEIFPEQKFSKTGINYLNAGIPVTSIPVISK